MTKTKIALIQLGGASLPIGESLSILMSARQDQYEFIVLPRRNQLPEQDMDDAYSWELMQTVLENEKKNVDVQVVIGVLSEPIEKNWFSHSNPESGTGVISTADWKAISDLPVHIYIANAVVQTLCSILASSWKGHDDTRGCLGDFCEIKADIVKSIESGYICSNCAETLRSELGQQGFGAIQNILHITSKSISKA